jgi:hypothetical protein
VLIVDANLIFVLILFLISNKAGIISFLIINDMLLVFRNYC